MHASEVETLDDLTAFVTERGYSPTDVAMAIAALRQPAPTGESGYEGSITQQLVDASKEAGSVAESWLGPELLRRAQFGFQKYGKYLHAHNGRDAWKDLKDELLDALQYASQLAHEDKLTDRQAQVLIQNLSAMLVLCRRST